MRKVRDKLALERKHGEKVQEAARQARFAAFKQARAVYKSFLRQEANPNSPLLISLCLYGTNRHVSFESEMVKSSLAGTKKNVPSIVRSKSLERTSAGEFSTWKRGVN
ncbi:hypothetical protein ACHAW5_000894 [Stephanodiscus triporus]|uniref:Uncharacterized protein n=1 Tax=Stephanodiscus triporus TaxID=2934178 RepID=A0ABD3NQB8_9STRA